MIDVQPPELADGGYWYVLEAIAENEDEPGWNFGKVPVGASAWYAEIGGIMYCVIRTKNPVAGVDTTGAVSISQVLGGAKPYARIGGQ